MLPFKLPMKASTLRPALILFGWIVLNGYAQEAPMVVSPSLPAGQIDPTLPRKLPDFLRSVKLPEAVRLPTLSADEARVTKRGPLTSTGVRRFVSPSLTRRATITSAGDSRTIQSVAITSPGAKRVRVHFRDFDAGTGEVWVFAPGDDFALPPFTGKGVFGDGEFWSAGVDSETVVIAYVTGSGGSSSGEPPFVIDAITHQWSRPSASGEAQASPGPNLVAASCNLDVSCSPTYVGFATAVALFDFVKDTGEVGFCSGSLINTRSSSLKPYFLTAHHCISSNTEARSMVVQFLDQTLTCNGTPPNPASLPPFVIGGTYLAGAAIAQGDYAFVQLTSAVAGVTFLGWNASLLGVGSSAVGIHHPQGSFTRISFGTLGVNQDASVGSETAPANLYYRVNWSLGLTEEGSSGSPLINSAGQILGTLTGGVTTPAGTAACQIPQWSTYGRFSNAYTAIGSYLNDTQPASLTVNPSSLAFQVTNGLVTPASQTVSVTTQSTSAISMTLQTSQPWLHVSGGPTVSASSPANLVVTVDPSTLTTPGTFSGTVTVSSTSAAPVTVSVSATVTARPSSVTVTVTPNPIYQQSTPSGIVWNFSVRATESAGVNTQLTGFKIGGTDLASRITTFFGTTTLSGDGTVLGAVQATNLSVPLTQTVELDGIDGATGRAWQTTAQATFLGTPQAVLQLTSTPNPVRQDTSAAANCQWSQELTLRETSGVPVTLTRFVAGGFDLSSKISQYFATTALSANGSLNTPLCWQTVAAPTTLNFELDGTDSHGNAVSAQASVSFLGPLAGVPSITVGGMVNGASFTQNVAPGSLMSIFGTSLATQTVSASSVPLPTSLAGVSVTFNGVRAPLYFVSPSQLNVQVPFEMVPGFANVTVTVNGQTDSQSVQVASVAPGIFTDGRRVVQFPSGNPGDILILYITGQGAVSPSVPTGNGPAAGSSVDQLPRPLQRVGLTIGGVNAPILFAGVPTGLVGVIQVNFQVPQVSPGDQPVVVTVGGQVSTSATFTVLLPKR
jgi:uncharacterized protein (TIGR03437 family)